MTEHLALKRQLTATKEQLITIINFLPDATLLLDEHKTVIAWNRAEETIKKATNGTISALLFN